MSEIGEQEVILRIILHLFSIRRILVRGISRDLHKCAKGFHAQCCAFHRMLHPTCTIGGHTWIRSPIRAGAC